jgi:hypothetical protein
LPSHGKHASFSRWSTRTTTLAGSSSISSVTSFPMHVRSAPHTGYARSAAGTVMGLGTRGRFAGGGLRNGGCFAGFSAALSVSASIPDAPRSLALASPRSGAPSSLASTPVAASASRKSLSCAVDTPSFL